MLRTCLRLVVCGAWLGPLAGCSHMVESRVVQAFAESLREHDLAGLKEQSSDAFENRAVSGKETFDALEMLDVPEGKVRVVKVVDKTDDKDKSKGVVAKRVTVEVGDGKTSEKKKSVYLLTRDARSGSWVVDDVYLSPVDEKERKSVAAQLAVLLSVRESLSAWKSGERDRILAAATSEFAGALSDLAPAQLARFAKRVTADVAPEARVLSKGQLREEAAELRVARLDAELVLKFRKVDARWKLDDLAVEARRGGGDVASARQVTAAMGTALRFQAAYRSSDKRTLSHVCSEQFFAGSLAGADLSLVRLPSAAGNLDDFDVKLEGATATFVVPAGKEILKITLSRQQAEKVHAAPRFRVDDVTIYELDSPHAKRLSALFTGHAALMKFSAALAGRDLKALRLCATHDFNERAWTKLNESHVAHLPLREIPPAPPQVQQTLFKGSLMQIHVEQGALPLTYVLRDEGGRMLVDDVLVPATARPESIKATLELIFPVLEFAAGLESARMDVVRGSSTQEFSRIAWNHFDAPPEFDVDPLPYLREPLRGVMVSGDRAVLALGSERQGANVTLMKEKGHYRVDDVALVLGPAPREPIALKRAIRTQLAQGN